MRRQHMVALIGLVTAAIIAASPMPAPASTEQQQLVDKAKLTAEAFASDPQQENIRQWLTSSKGVFIIPQVLRGAFVFGGAGGGGLLLVYDENSGEWSQPAFYNIGAVSFGLQAGADTSELIVVVRTQKGLEEFYRSDFKLGADVGVSAGSLGSSVSMEGVTADLLSFGPLERRLYGYGVERRPYRGVRGVQFSLLRGACATDGYSVEEIRDESGFGRTAPYDRRVDASQITHVLQFLHQKGRS